MTELVVGRSTACHHSAAANQGCRRDVCAAGHAWLCIPQLLPTSVSTKRFQETSRERKPGLMKNPLVKSVFLRPLDYFVPERPGSEIIKLPRCIPALALGTLLSCSLRAVDGSAHCLLFPAVTPPQSLAHNEQGLNSASIVPRTQAGL